MNNIHGYGLVLDPLVYYNMAAINKFLSRSFTMFTSEERIQRKIEELESALKKDDLTDYIDPETAYIYGGYDSPWTIPFLRHNEVWLLQN